MKINNLPEKISKLPDDAVDLFIDLLTDLSIVDHVILNNINNIELNSEEKEQLIYSLIDIEIENDRKNIAKVISQLTIDPENRTKIEENIKDSVWFELDEIYSKQEEEKSNLLKIAKKIDTTESKNNLEDSKLADLTHISHHDLLSEIENPTPSISTTANFQANVVKSAGTINTTTNSTTDPSTSATTAKVSSNVKTNLTPVNLADPSTASLHSSASVAPYTNPALHIASKLDQKLSAPAASIPKDIYVSKKPDPYHEPVDF